MASRSRLFSKIAKDVDVTGNLTAAAISSDVSFGATVYDSTGVLPYVGNTTGDQAYVRSNNRFYIWDSAGWYNVALINRAPTITSVLDSDGASSPFALVIDGTPTTITITATDSDGDLITYSAVTDANFDGLASITGSGNEFTVTPFSQDSATTESGTITFKATDGINISSNISTFTLYFVSALWDETVLSIGTNSTNSLNNSTFIDRSTNAHTVTPTGTPIQTAFHPYLDNWSMEVSGSEWIQTISSQSAFDFSDDGDFTIEMWVKDNLSTDGVRTIMNMKSGTYGFLFRRHSSNRWELYYNGANRTYLNIADYGGLTDWYHMAITHSSGTLRWFVNGTAGFTTSSIDTSTYNFTTLDLASYSSGNWNGYFSNVRVVKGTALYTSDFTPPTEKLTAVSGTTFLGYQSNRFIDNSGNNEQITISAGDPKISAYNPFGQGSEYAVGENKGSYYQDGTNTDQVYANDGLSGDSYTIEFWWYPTDLARAHLLYDRAFRNNVLSLQTDYTGATSTVFYRDGGEASTTVNQSLTNQWNHIVVTRSANYHYLYVNGVRYSFASVGGAVNSSGNLYVGCASSAGSGYEYNQGWISDFRVTASSLYSSTTITPPTAPVGNTNASLYLPMDNAGIFDKTGNHDLTLGTGTKTTTSQTKYSDTSIDFNNNDYRVYAPGIEFPGDFTMEGWVWWPFNAGNRLIATNRSSVGATGAGQWWIDEYNGNRRFYFDTGARIDVSGQFSTDQWSHWAVCRSGSTVRVFINGTNVGSATTTNNLGSSNTIKIGGFSDTNSYAFVGYQEGFQILKGIAKYTANFTVPDREQGISYQAES